MIGAYPRKLGFAFCAALFVAGCGDETTQTFDGMTFRASLDADREAPHDFVVEVRDAGKSLAGAREAGRYEAVRYCIETFGNSRMTWLQGPDADDADLRIENGNLIMQGQCAGW
ncbi:hypothetical protein M8756_02630 [Lutimaribacter sp. EGI FJ00015]|uniref:Uncharacterized protein n=1 Tax=Lutimaribacter degradans TaxID=2945989 RepID=A0ACC5ZTZ2_9RHOB|nr:hypothetical protein [Lutimaribacter sp. EGI FJ00013]MCM2560864.1 hypothetical protein [Lutimaribacter sp. EGI FJ00013]MCO0612191.1 hypothetical protein [Lutimaribacter sp. EGI FJ00015]MCO0634689.1 hypothetical protein [Lutimaribacter sp. EGI FJ00014]